MRRHAFILLAISTGCQFRSSPVTGDDDASVDGTATIDGQSCFGPAAGNFTICFGADRPLPTQPLLVVSMASLNTDTDCTFLQPQTGGGPDLCVVAATSISIQGTLTATGTRPLALLAIGQLAVTSTIDVASHRAGGVGAGAITCAGASQAGANSATGGGGGAGGSFGRAGGDGGTGGAGGASGGHAAAPATLPDALFGGCTGGRGGDGDAATGGPAGPGGGAVYLVSGGAMTIAGKINASGAGASGGTQVATGRGGGGGGGAGGMIVVFAPDLTFSPDAVMMANGGGGGAGASATVDGGAGSDPDPLAPLTAAASGTGAAGQGGSGGAGNSPAGAGASANDGGGGGGGAVGFIRILSGQPATNATLSPPAS